MFNYGQIIEYVDGTRDLNLEAARKWAETSNAHFLEIEPKEDGVRQFKIVEKTLDELKEEVRWTRANLYQEKVDPLTAHIQRLRDEEQTDEVVAEIESLLAERATMVVKIKEENPYPVVEEPVTEPETVVEEPSEEPLEPVELYSMEI